MKSNPIAAISAVLFAFFIQGFCDIVGISSEYAREAFGWSHTMAGLLPSMVFVWFLFVSIPVGIKMNAWGRKNTVLLGMLVTVVGMLVPLIGTSWACIVGYAALGIGNAMLQVSQNALVRNVFSDEKLLTSSITAGQVVKAVSSFCGPFLMLFAVNVLGGGDKAHWYLVFPVLGLITLLSGLWLWLTPIRREPQEPTDVTMGKTLALLGNRTILLLFVGIFFVVGIDVGTNFVSSKVMIDRFGWEVTQAGIAPQVYFICRTVGAFLGVFIMTKVSSVSYFRWNIITCIVVILLLAFCRFSPTLTLALIGAIGFLCSCIFPIIYSMAVRAEPTQGNLISGLMITAVAGGGAVTPFIGFATDRFGNITAGVSVLLVCAAYLTYCAVGVKVRG
ncbi:MAG: MFS transporter [Prevotella sp.]|nr:MFS transporter [Prevotella sp.]